MTHSGPTETRRSRGIGWFDLIAAIVVLALAIALLVEGHRAAAAAVRDYGRNVDSGAYEWTVAWLVLLPMALSFLVASILRRKNEKVALGFRIFAFSWPIMFALLMFLTYR